MDAATGQFSLGSTVDFTNIFQSKTDTTHCAQHSMNVTFQPHDLPKVVVKTDTVIGASTPATALIVLPVHQAHIITKQHKAS